MTEPYGHMRMNWQKVWRGLNLQGDPNPWFDQILDGYSQPHRHYHGIHHIDACLQEMRDYRAAHGSEAIEPLDEAEMAIYLHDLVYDPHSKTNELDSALWGAHMLREAAGDSAMITRIFNMVMATLHREPPVEPAHQLVVDIDLSALGVPLRAFEKNTEAIRREYAWVPEDVFCKTRASILNGFLQRDRIFTTEHFFAKYEATARRNLQHAIAKLGGG